MSEDFVDVTWRGLEVVKKAKLRGKDARSAYLEHGTPMPTGSQLVIRTADGHELAAVVARVQEQIGGRTEPPGMELAIEAQGAAATWWLSRVESHARSLRAAARETMIMTHGPDDVPDLAVAPIAAVIDTGPMRAITPEALAQVAAGPPPVAAEVAPAPAALEPAAEAARPEPTSMRVTQPMPTVAPPRDTDQVAVPQGIDESNDGEGLVDDGKRTMVMDAVDIDAIVAASTPAPGATPPEDDATSPGNGSGDKKKGARGKRTRKR